ncbi:hypothetical protein ACFQYP_57510 [Nonomuraea antimicrobica]
MSATLLGECRAFSPDALADLLPFEQGGQLPRVLGVESEDDAGRPHGWSSEWAT